jgi:hypothetical protein
MIPRLMPTQDRPLGVDERNRLHASLVEIEHAIGELPADVGHWYRVFLVQASTLAPPEVRDVHLIARRRPTIHMGEAPQRWWHRFTDWWWKW